MSVVTPADPPLVAVPAPPAAAPASLVDAPQTAAGRRRVLLPVTLVLAAMVSVQTGAAVSVPLFATFGVAGTTWLRLTVAAAVLLVLARPRGMRRDDVLVAAGLGAVMAVNAVLFSAATSRVPLGTVVAVEFCGPLAVAALGARGQGRRRYLWPAVALAGVLLVTRPWSVGGAEAAIVWQGLAMAAAAAVGWAAYIVLTAHVGRRSEGLRGLAVALAASAVVLAPFGAVEAWPAVTAALSGGAEVTALARAGLAALLVPLCAYALEMAALRRLDQGVFGVWMALEPAIGTVAGLVLLAQPVAILQWPGVFLVVLAGVGAQRAVRIPRPPHEPSAP